MSKSFFIALSFLIINVSLAYSQRKDTDAKISVSNNVRAATKGRDKVADATIRIRYAFNAEDISDKSTWIDEG